MKVKSFAVSVQWGEGHHYFVRTDLESELAARDDATARAKQLAKQKHKHNLKPSVYVWTRV